MRRAAARLAPMPQAMPVCDHAMEPFAGATETALLSRHIASTPTIKAASASTPVTGRISL